MECCGLHEQEPNGGKCRNVMDRGKVFMQDLENGNILGDKAYDAQKIGSSKK